MIPDPARSHAASAGKQQENGELSIENEQPITSTPSSSTEIDSESLEGSHARAVQDRRTGKSTSNSRGHLSPRRETNPSPRHIEADVLQYLPLHDPSVVPMGSTLESHSSTLNFFGESFVKQFLMMDHEDYSIMLSGCMLLSYANTMALSGSGTKATLLGLKGQVINRINAKIESSGGLLSPQCFVAILALGAPIVCLVSQDLPHSLKISQNALYERKMHSQAIDNLFSKISGRFRDQDSFSLLLYLSNYRDLTMALEAANYLDTPLIGVGILFPTTFPCIDCSIPTKWTSPLTCQWLAGDSSKPIEEKMLKLAGTTHKWLATFLGGDSQILVPTKDVLEERSSLREAMEAFEPVGKISNCESEAMYECCRWASLVLLKVEKLRIPIYAAAKHARIHPRLTRRLRMTDLSNLWGKWRGLLFWVAAVCDFCTAGQCFPLLCTTLLARMAQEISLLDCSHEVGIKALKRLKVFESICCEPAPAHEPTNLDFRSYLSAYCETNGSRTTPAS
ncbi:hypothetical protein N431DRAFT_554920 [Stipitochalara longipes BDJ]|nr:hypothetical protein N431DRAFT_554920 [Stipitochalara longipes BDJ]